MILGDEKIVGAQLKRTQHAATLDREDNRSDNERQRNGDGPAEGASCQSSGATRNVGLWLRLFRHQLGVQISRAQTRVSVLLNSRLAGRV